MGKISGYNSDSSIQTTDYVVGVQASGPTTSRFTFANIITFLKSAMTAFPTANLYNAYKFYATAASGPNIGSSTSVQPLIFSSKTYDTSNNYNAATGVFTAPIAGFYKFDVFMDATTLNGDEIYVNLFKNGSQIQAGPDMFNNSGATNPIGMTFSVPPLQLAANDTVTVQMGHSSAYNMGVSANSYFSGYLISQT